MALRGFAAVPAFGAGNARHCRRGLWCRDPNLRRAPSVPNRFRCGRGPAVPGGASPSRKPLRPHCDAMSGTAIVSLCRASAAAGRASAGVVAPIGVANWRSARSVAVAGRRSVRSAFSTARSVQPGAGCFPPVGGGWPPELTGWWSGCSSARKGALPDSVGIDTNRLRFSTSSRLLS